MAVLVQFGGRGYRRVNLRGRSSQRSSQFVPLGVIKASEVARLCRRPATAVNQFSCL